MAQACLNQPGLVLAGTIGAIALKEVAPIVGPPLKKVIDPAIDLAQEYPKCTALTASAACSALLPYAATGEPVTVAVTGTVCAASAVALLAYLVKEQPEQQS